MPQPGKMNTYLLVLALVGYVAVEGCTDADKAIVKEQWEEVFDNTNRVTFGTEWFRSVFEQEPEGPAIKEEYFHDIGGGNVNSASFASFGMMVVAGVNNWVSHFDNPQAMAATMRNLKRAHTQKYISDETWQVFKERLFATLALYVEDLDADAWNPCYDELVTNIK